MSFRGIKAGWLILGLIIVPFVPQMPSCMMANRAKYGRVIDTTTGKGIPGVAIIQATILYVGSSFAAGNTLTRVITYTDENGNYGIPSAWLRVPADLPVRAPGTNAHTVFLITAFKPGYAFVGDDDAWKLYDQFGQPRYRPKSTVIPPHALWLGPITRVDSLEMKPVEFSLREAAIYYRMILGTGSLPIYQALHDPDGIALTSAAYKYFLPLVCALPPDTEMDLSEGSGFTSTTTGDEFTSRLRKLEPTGFKDAYMRPILHAKNVCEAMQVKGEQSEVRH